MYPEKLPVLFEDSDYIAVAKPHELLVHKTALCADKITAMHIVRDMAGCHVDPVHRIDRATAGVLLFSKNKEATKFASDQFMNKEVTKTYLAIIRGWPKEDEGVIDSPIKNDKGQSLEALTRYNALAKIDLPFPVGRFSSSWYSLNRAIPETGRTHQIRRHLKRLCGPIIGDTKHGDSVHNNLFKEKFDSTNLLLFAESLKFKKMDGEEVFIKASLPESFQSVFKEFKWNIEDFKI
ncbi:MAG: pseudouridine synthase [Lentisphaeraceae bacterium]|nr:pseudouridine synthase [Lentisphaeraceae bacterium]